MSKGLSLRREMSSLLTRKLCSKGMGDEDLLWPLGSRDEPNDTHNETMWDSDSEVEDSWREDYFRELRRLYDGEGLLDAPAFREQFVDILPAHWTVCSLTVDTESDTMYVT